MNDDFAGLEALRGCCKDEAAFEQCKQVLASIRATYEQSETALKESEARNRALLNGIPDLMFRIKRDGTYVGLKADQESDFAIDPQEMIGKKVHDVLPPDVAEQRMRYIEQTLQTGKMQVFDYQLTHYRGGVRDYEARIVSSGVDEVFVIVRDITDRKLAEASLRLSEEKFCKAFRSSPGMISISTFKEGRYIEVNDSALSITGYTREEVIGHTAAELKVWVNPADGIKIRELLQRDGVVRNMEAEFRKKNGEILIGLFSAEIIDFEGELCLLAMIINITEHRRAQIELKAALERDRLLGEIALRIRRSLNLDQILHTTVAEVRQLLQADRVFIAHPDENSQGKIKAESVDFRWPSILGWVADESLVAELRATFQGNQPQVINDTSQLEATPVRCAVMEQHKVKASIAVPILLGDQFFGVLVAHQCSSPRLWQQFEIDLLEKLATQVAIAIQQAELYEQVQSLNTNLELQVQERTLQLRQKIKELQELSELKDFFLHAVSHDLRTPIMGMLLVLKNLLNRNTLESSTSDRKSVESSIAPALVGDLKEHNSHRTNVADDLHSSIYTFSQIAQSLNNSVGNSTSADTVAVPRSVLERMIQSSDRQLEMLNLLLDSHAIEARGAVLNYTNFALEHLIEAIIPDLEPLLQKNQANLTNTLPQKLPQVRADFSQIRRVLENLITNALKHNPPGLYLTINAFIDAQSPGMLFCTLQDNGVGIEDGEQLFERYTKGKHSKYSTGIGLGLYLCRQIITSHGGQIGVNSSLGHGAKFWFTIPIASPSSL